MEITRTDTRHRHKNAPRDVITNHVTHEILFTQLTLSRERRKIILEKVNFKSTHKPIVGSNS